MEVASPQFYHSSRIKKNTKYLQLALKLSCGSCENSKVSHHKAILRLRMHKALVSHPVCYFTLCRSVVQVFKNIQYVFILSGHMFVLSDKITACWCDWEANIQVRDLNVHGIFKMYPGFIFCFFFLSRVFTWQQKYVLGLVASGLVIMCGKILNSLTIWTKEEAKRFKKVHFGHTGSPQFMLMAQSTKQVQSWFLCGYNWKWSFSKLIVYRYFRLACNKLELSADSWLICSMCLTKTWNNRCISTSLSVWQSLRL